MPLSKYLDNDWSSSSPLERTSLLPITNPTSNRTPPETDTCTTSRISRITTTLKVIAHDVCLRLSHTLSTLFSLLLRPLVALGRCLSRTTQKNYPDSGNLLPFTTHSSLVSHSDPSTPSTSSLLPLFSPSPQPNHSPSSLPTPNARTHFLSTPTDPTTTTSTSSSLSSSPSSVRSSPPPFSIHSLRSALKNNNKNSTDSSATLLLTLEPEAEHEPDAESSSSSTPTGTVTTNSASTTTTSSGLSTPIPIDIPGVNGNTTARKSVRFTGEDDLRVFEVESWEAREKRTSGNGGLGKWKKVGKTIVWQDGPERDHGFSSSRSREEANDDNDDDDDDDDEWWSNSFLYSWFLPTPPPPPQPSSSSFSSSFSSLSPSYSTRSSFLGSSPPGGRRSPLSSSFITSYGDEMRLRDGLF